MPPDCLKQITDTCFEIPESYKEGMLVPARIYGTKSLVDAMDEGVFDQVTNVACLPGIQKYAMCMPDGHWGYGFPIGGVAAMDPKTGVISPGGIGFDINCGMRLMTTNLHVDDVRPKLHELVDLLFYRVPVGVGCKGFVDLNRDQFEEVCVQGAQWCIQNGYGWDEDKDRIEDYGRIPQADPSMISEKAIKRGIDQLGTLGSGNHYLEIQVVNKDEIYNPEIAEKWGIRFDGQIVIMVHCGSRGFGHQVATDYLKLFDKAMPKYGIVPRDRELGCAPFQSEEGQNYYKAMACAANMAFANRQVISHRIRECFSQVFSKPAEELEIQLVYDVAHNIAKLEEFELDGKKKEYLVHRKGSTRSFGPGRKELADIYKETGQPVILGGSMETGSHLLVGTNQAEQETFGSTAHGSGRTMSRHKAKKMVRGDKLQRDMEHRGIYVRSVSFPGLAEEAGFAYKDINEVVEAIDKADLAKKVVGLRPLGNIKG